MNKQKVHEKVKKLHRDGLTYREISKKTKVSIGTISNILNGNTNPNYSRKDPGTWKEPELKQKIAFSEAAIGARGKSMEVVNSSIAVSTGGKTYKPPAPRDEQIKPISNREFARMINDMDRFTIHAEKVDAAIKESWDKLPPQSHSGVSVPAPITIDSPDVPVPESPGVRVPVPGHGSGFKTLKIMGGIVAVLGGIVIYKEVEKKQGTVAAVRLAQQAGLVLSDVIGGKKNV